MNSKFTWIALIVIVLFGVAENRPSNHVSLPDADIVDACKRTQVCQKCRGGAITGIYYLFPGTLFAPNLTESDGLAGWTEADLVTLIVTWYKPNGQQLNDHLPWETFINNGDPVSDATLIWSYLKALSSAPQK